MDAPFPWPFLALVIEQDVSPSQQMVQSKVEATEDRVAALGLVVGPRHAVTSKQRVGLGRRVRVASGEVIDAGFVGELGGVALLELARDVGLGDGLKFAERRAGRCSLFGVGGDGIRPWDGALEKADDHVQLHLERDPSPDEMFEGSPVLVGDMVIGLVTGSPRGRRLELAPANEIRALYSAVSSLGGAESGEVGEILAATLAVAGTDQPTPNDLLVGALAWAEVAQEQGVARDLYRSLAEPRSNRVRAALAAVGAPPDLDVRRLPAPVNPDEAGLGRIVARADAYASAIRGALDPALRDVLAVAVTTDELHPNVLDALGVTAKTLRADLRAAIGRAHPEETEWDNLLGPIPDTSATVEPLLAGHVDSDLVVWDPSIRLVDRLNVSSYVDMLSAVVGAYATPLPISIGLFGEWGSGKTYFMGLIRQKLDGMAEQERDARAAAPDRVPLYCAQIEQITFNAWHYADANLWASLAVHIFEELSGAREGREAAVAIAKQELVENLEVYRTLSADLKQASDEAKDKVGRYAAQLEEAQAKQAASEASIERLTIKDVADVVSRDPRVAPRVAEVRQQARDLGLESADAELEVIAAELQSVRARGSLLWRLVRRRDGRLLIVAGAAALALGVVLLVAVGDVLPAVAGFVTPLVAAIAAAWSRVRRAVDWLLQKAEIVSATGQALEAKVKAKDEAELTDQRARLEAAKAEQREAEDKLADAQVQADKLQKEIDDLGAGRRLARFIADRSASDDYRKQLGVISLVRRDFEDLVELLRARLKPDRSPESESTVERIVLYIDDLDRCPPARVVEVLEAVHLLLALDLFVVVVGVDPRWLLQSLQSRYRGLLAPTAADGDTDDAYWHTTPQNYLEKIFQIPFVLPGMTQTGLAALLGGLLRPVSDPSAKSSTPVPDGVAGSESIVPASERESAATEPAAAPTDPTETPVQEGSLIDALRTGSAPPPLDLTDTEVQFMATLADLVRTPRAAKRMANVYRMLRATRDAPRFLGSEDAPGEYQVVAQLLAVVAGFPELFGLMCWRSDEMHRDAAPLLARDANGLWTAFIVDLQPEEASGGWTNKVAGTLDVDAASRWKDLADALRGRGRESGHRR